MSDPPVTDAACSTSTGSRATVTRRAPSEEELDRTIDQVAQRALRTWLDGNPDQRLGDLRANRPSIPPALDKALLIDLVAELGENELLEKTRRELRGRVWNYVDRR